MSEDPKEQPSEAAARYLADKGIARIELMQATVDRARELLESGEISEPVEGTEPNSAIYKWEKTERSPDAPRRVWIATVEDFATGEGVSIHCVAGFAGDADEFRRQIAPELGRHLANGAQVREGAAGFGWDTMFLTPHLRTLLAAWDRGDDRPAVMRYFAVFRANYS
ncbi:hypothetical protein [Altericroceibacterium xinjiangense]|uniref:hypothetical protein n=1 Tax=Altericroceibacterium xinjiangense TaxID=762261 RepID=UPI000F7ED0E2|nr:hypothetical protein [Altericroceibacterium xinjiangense]